MQIKEDAPAFVLVKIGFGAAIALLAAVPVALFIAALRYLGAS